MSAVAIVGTAWQAAELVRLGQEQWNALGESLQTLASVAAQPIASHFIPMLEKTSLLLWPVVALNSMLWGIALGITWAAFASRFRHEYT